MFWAEHYKYNSKLLVSAIEAKQIWIDQQYKEDRWQWHIYDTVEMIKVMLYDGIAYYYPLIITALACELPFTLRLN